MARKLTPRRERLTFERLLQKAHELDGESERGLAVVGGELVSHALEQLIRAFLPRDVGEVDSLFADHNAVLGTFSARQAMAFHLGLIDRSTHSDVGTVRAIRNLFAHGIDGGCSFSAPDVVAAVDSFTHLLWMREGHIFAEQPVNQRIRSLFRQVDTRAHYSWALSLILSDLSRRTKSTTPLVLGIAESIVEANRRRGADGAAERSRAADAARRDRKAAGRARHERER